MHSFLAFGPVFTYQKGALVALCILQKAQLQTLMGLFFNFSKQLCELCAQAAYFFQLTSLVMSSKTLLNYQNKPLNRFFEDVS